MSPPCQPAHLELRRRLRQQVRVVEDRLRRGRSADDAIGVAVVQEVSAFAELDQVESAMWSTQSTLTIRMLHTDGVDDTLVAAACGLLADYEEIRYSRLQLEAPAVGATTAPVRWRVCQ